MALLQYTACFYNICFEFVVAVAISVAMVGVFRCCSCLGRRRFCFSATLVTIVFIFVGILLSDPNEFYWILYFKVNETFTILR